MPKLKDEIIELINANSAPYVKNFHYSGRFITDDDIERIATTISASKENEGKRAGVFVKASERMPEYNKVVNGKLNGLPALVKNSNLAKGYMTANGNLERIVFIEWLDESIQSGERGEVERLKGE